MRRLSILVCALAMVAAVPSAEAKDGKSKHGKYDKQARYERRSRHDRQARYDRQSRYERDRFGYEDNYGSRGDEFPHGLAKRDTPPPGLQKQLERRGQLPPGLERRTGSTMMPRGPIFAQPPGRGMGAPGRGRAR